MANFGYFGEILNKRIEKHEGFTLVRGLTCEFLIMEEVSDGLYKVTLWPRGAYNSRINGIGTETKPTNGALRIASRLEAKAIKHINNYACLEASSNLRYSPIWEFRPFKSFWYNWLGLVLMAALGYYIQEIAVIVFFVFSTIMWNFSFWLIAAMYMSGKAKRRQNAS